MFNSTDLTQHWSIVEAIVKSRGRTLQKYEYFERLWDSVEGNDLVFLSAPTGAGKTEAALTPFLKSLIHGERFWHSLIYVLPTRSLVFNMFHRICKTLHICRSSFKRPRMIVVDYDHGGFTPFKAFIEGDITVTTYDTLLYTLYGFRSYGHHFFLSVGKIAGSLIILDEVQLLQDSQWYSLTLLPYHIANLINFGATVILMSATLPQILVEETVRPFKKYQRVKYPIKYSHPYTFIEADSSKDVIRRGRLDVIIKDGRLSESLFDIIKNYEKPMLFIYNTVEEAVEAYRRLTKNDYNNVILLHSRLINDVRKSREEVFEKSSIDQDLIVVATQVIEAGIDYDFKTIATQVSPIDSLIQRLGRCARKSDGTALLFKDLEGAKCVYPQIVIDETIKILNEDDLAESVKNISTASKLVNAVYREDVVRELRGEIDRELSEALSFIKTFSTDSAKIFVARNLFKIPNLLRLGIEVKCILLPQEIYQRIMESLRSGSEKSTFEIPLTQAIDLLHRNTLSLSVERLYRGYEIPALSHRIDGEEFYLSLSIEYKTDLKNQASEPKVDLNIVKYRRLSDCYREVFIHPFIINPLYYIVERDFHLGLVKPYG